MTWNVRARRFVRVQEKQDSEPRKPPVVLPLRLRIVSLAESVIAEVLRLRVLGPSNQVLLKESAAEHRVHYWHAWQECRSAVIGVQNIMPFRSSVAGDAPCTTGRYAISVVFEDERLQASEAAAAEKVFAETFGTIGDENQTLTCDRKGWIRLEKATMDKQSVGGLSLVVAVESHKVSHPLSPNEMARFEQVRWNNRTRCRKSIGVSAIFDVQEAETAVARMLREGADPALLEVQIQKVQALRARRDYLCHRAEEASRIAKEWKNIAYGPA